MGIQHNIQHIGLDVAIAIETNGSYDTDEMRGTIEDSISELLHRDFPRLLRCVVTLQPQETACQSAT
jgi:hypothetical protein